MNWEQFRAILWLRWRLTRNQLTRGGGLNAAIASLAGVILVLIALGAGSGAALLGAVALKHASVTKMMFVWDGVVLFVLFFSLIAVATELQRSESVDLTRLLHLPIGLRQVFLFNYLVSLVSLGTVLALAIMLGLAAGLVISQGPRFLLAIPLVVAFVFMLTAWIYCLRGWLLSLMVNPRRRRSIIMWITLGVILLAQSPQLINAAYQRKARRDRQAQRAAQPQSADPQTAAPQSAFTTIDQKIECFAVVAGQVHPWVPVLWLANGTRGLAAGEVWPAIWGGAAMLALGWLGLGRAYRATLRFYRAEERAKPQKPTPAPVGKARPARNWVELRLPWVAEDTAALALAQCRSMTRAPEVRMMLAMGLFAAIVLPAMLFWRGGSAASFSETAKPFIGTGAVLMILFMLVQIACNQFGWDRDGFRSLVLLPTPRERLLLGKNLALLPVAAAIALVPLAVVSVWAKLPALIVLGNVLQFVAAFLLFCALGNLASILVPYRIAPGSLKPGKQSWQTSLLLLVVHASFPLVAAPVFLPPLLGFGVERLGWLPAAPVHLAAALVMVVAFAALYWLTLPALGRLLQRRETKILRAVTEVLE